MGVRSLALAVLTVLMCRACARRTVVVTGGNRGIGLAAVRQLAATDDWSIVLACRDAALGDRAVASLPERSRGNVRVDVLDLADLASVRGFCARFIASKSPLHVLACNAGVQHSGTKEVVRTRDGFEDTVGTNHIGHFLLVDLLLGRIDGKDGRVVFVGSGVHNPDEPGGDVGSKVLSRSALASAHELVNPGAQASLGAMSGLQAGFRAPVAMVDGGAYDGDKAYKDSKLCNVMTALELARRLKKSRSRVTCNVMNPGLIPTTGTSLAV